MKNLTSKIDNWIFDLDNTLYSADSGIFQQVHKLMGKFIKNYLNIETKKANELQRKYYKEHGTTLRGMMDNHGVDPDYFLSEVHKLDYSIVGSNNKLNMELKKLNGKKIIYTNANMEHVLNVLERIELSNCFDHVFDIKMANYIPKPQLTPYNHIVKKFDLNPSKSAMFDDIAKNLVPAKNVGFSSVWIDHGYENFTDDIKNSEKYLDYKTKDLSLFLDKVNRGEI